MCLCLYVYVCACQSNVRQWSKLLSVKVSVLHVFVDEAESTKPTSSSRMSSADRHSTACELSWPQNDSPVPSFLAEDRQNNTGP